jgi:hypothetical protein
MTNDTMRARTLLTTRAVASAAKTLGSNSCKRWLANGGFEALLMGLGWLAQRLMHLMGLLGWLARRLMHLAKPRLTVQLANAPLIAVGTSIAVGTFRLENNP